MLTWVPPIEPHKKKHAEEQMLIGPVPDHDRTRTRTEHLDLVPGRRIAGRPLLLDVPGGGRQDGRNVENTSHLCVCVCVCVALKRACPPDSFHNESNSHAHRVWEVCSKKRHDSAVAYRCCGACALEVIGIALMFHILIVRSAFGHFLLSPLDGSRPKRFLNPAEVEALLSGLS